VAATLPAIAQILFLKKKNERAAPAPTAPKKKNPAVLDGEAIEFMAIDDKSNRV
jgi:hypothetical protein